jgi:hypothetical protein
MPDVTTDLPKVSDPDELRDFVLHFVETNELDGPSRHDLDVSGWGDDGFPIQGSVNTEVASHKPKDGYVLGFGRPSQFLQVGWQLVGFSSRKHYTGKHWVDRRTAQIEVNP